MLKLASIFFIISINVYAHEIEYIHKDDILEKVKDVYIDECKKRMFDANKCIKYIKTIPVNTPCEVFDYFGMSLPLHEFLEDGSIHPNFKHRVLDLIFARCAPHINIDQWREE